MFKKSWSCRRDVNAVTPVMATIFLVSITIVLVAVLFVSVSGLLSNPGDQPPIADMTMSTIENGYLVVFSPFSRDTVWSDVGIILSDGSRMASFYNMSTVDMHPGTYVTKCLGNRTLGNFEVFMNVTDLAGDGHLSSGDRFTITTSGGMFQTNVDYELMLMYKPGGALITSKTFSGHHLDS